MEQPVYFNPVLCYFKIVMANLGKKGGINWSKKRILVLGLGKEGTDNLRFLRRLFPDKVLGAADIDKGAECPKKRVRCFLGKNYLKSIKHYDLILKSPGIPIHLPEVERAYKQGKITSQSEIFFENCPGKIIGVTGTKGKSTTASLIYEILRKGGVGAHLIGNIGKPALNLLFSATANDIYVYELSCHQLYKLKKSPHIAVLLNIYPEHLDYYKDFKEYIATKARITRYQKENDFLLYNPNNKIVREIAKKSRAKKIPLRPGRYKFIKDMEGKIPLIGLFNLENITAAVAIAKMFGIKEGDIRKAIKGFQPLPHRLELVGRFRGITFYNDSLSTIPQAAIAALEALGNRVETIILGGFDRGLSFKGLAKTILKSRVKAVILFPSTGERIWREIRALDKNPIKSFLVQNMRDAVELAFKYTGKGKICLLSPASPSFGLFKNYKERGNLFKKYVKMYGKNH